MASELSAELTKTEVLVPASLSCDTADNLSIRDHLCWTILHLMFIHLSSLLSFFFQQPDPGISAFASSSFQGSEPPARCDGQPAGGFFNNAKDFMQNNPQMNDFTNAQIQQLVFQTITQGDATVERLLPYTCQDASINSSARHPPPRCHEGTREKIGEKLKVWFHDPNQRRRAMWLYGPAGTGKSAVAQTFGEYCEASDSLGASFFFSRPNHRDKHETVIPTIAYQLATSLPSFRTALTRVIATDPTVLEKSPRVQLKKLLVEPFSDLYSRNDPVARKRFLVVLDGLDECYGLKGQLEIIEIINEANQLAHLPLLWLVCSRPEPHLMYIFSRAIECDRHQLVIDADTRQDVEKYLRDGFRTMQIELLGSVDEAWPRPELFKKVVDITDGLFVLGTAILGYVGNSAYANPAKRLTDFLCFMEHAARIATDNPLETLDLLYSRILMDIPGDVMPMTQRILHHCVYTTDKDQRTRPIDSTLALANFLCMDQQEFYSALRSLHSVLEVPSPEDAANVPLQMYHASFKDFLCSPSRAGRFFISEEEARAEFSKSRFFWFNIILEDEVSDNMYRWTPGSTPRSIFPRLKWISSNPERDVQRVDYFTHCCRPAWVYLCYANVQSGSAEMLSFCNNFRFQYMELIDARMHGFLQFLSWLSQQGLSEAILRTEPTHELDKTLLKGVSKRFSKHKLSLQVEPMVFPLVNCEDSLSTRRYCFLGQGMKTCLFWTDEKSSCLGRARLGCKAIPGDLTVSDCVLHACDDVIFYATGRRGGVN